MFLSHPFSTEIAVHGLANLVRKDKICEGCQLEVDKRQRRGVSLTCKFAARDNKDWVYCYICYVEHPSSCFSREELQKESNRACIAKTGYVRLCEHKVLFWYDLEHQAMRPGGFDEIQICRHPSHLENDLRQNEIPTAKIVGSDDGKPSLSLSLTVVSAERCQTLVTGQNSSVAAEQVLEAIQSVRRHGAQCILPERSTKAPLEMDAFVIPNSSTAEERMWTPIRKWPKHGELKDRNDWKKRANGLPVFCEPRHYGPNKSITRLCFLQQPVSVTMEPVGATASILTFVTVAFSATKSIYGALSAIKDGPEVLSSINDEISQLQDILQRLLQVVSSTARPTDRSKLEQMVKKCRDDLVGYEVKLRQFDVSGADGRRGQLWRKLKLCFEEKELDRIRHAVGKHVQSLTLYLGTIQDQQSWLIAAQSTDILARVARLQQSSSTTTQSAEILNRIEGLQQTSPTATQLNEVLVSLQQLQQDMAVLRVSCTSAKTQTGSSGIPSRVVELDDKNSPISQQTALDDTIARLMRLLYKKPSIMKFDDAQEIFDDLERLLQRLKRHEAFRKSDFLCPILESQEPMNSFHATEPRVPILQQRKRKEMDTGDNILTVTTAKRRRKLLPLLQNTPESEACAWGFLGNLNVKSKTKKKMITVSVNRVSQILPNDSHVFQVASQGSVQDLMRLIVENKASLHDHDENGWSLLHHAVGNLPVLRFLIEEGLDVDEVAQENNKNHTRQTNPLILAYRHRYDIEFS
ncbi:uncharacterized protein FFB14_12200 [Fusarium fujikuroi]|nr:uncharacterized protein FFB14_12200 [Fusarium fujikuroi]